MQNRAERIADPSCRGNVLPAFTPLCWCAVDTGGRFGPPDRGVAARGEAAVCLVVADHGQIRRVQTERVQDSLATMLPFSSIISMTTRWTPPGRGMENGSLRTWSGPPAYAQALQ